jgi:hypothetical protein
MSLLLRGKTTCPICGRVIQERDVAISFPAFVWNGADPLALFSDASFHLACVDAHPLHEQVVAAVAELEAKTGPGKRRCVVCSNEISNPDDYLFIPKLTSNPSDPLWRYNFVHLHRSHARAWKGLPDLVSGLKELLASGTWKGNALPALIAEVDGHGPT